MNFEAEKSDSQTPEEWLAGIGTDRRRHKRKRLVLSGKIIAGDRDIPCITLDISEGGLRIHACEEFSLGSQIVISIERYGLSEGIVKWIGLSEIGMQFTNMSPEIRDAFEGIA